MPRTNPVDKEARKRIWLLIQEKTEPLSFPAITKLLQRYEEDVIVDAIAMLPLNHYSPYGYIITYCKSMAKGQQKKKNPLLTMGNIQLKLKK